MGLFITIFVIFFIGVSRVDAKSYKIRLYDRNDTQVVNKDNTNPTDYNGLIAQVYINYVESGLQANKTTYFAMDTTIGIRTCLTDTIMGRVECIPTMNFNKIFWYDNNGTTHEITESCNVSLTKTTTNTTSNNSKLTQWRAIVTCSVQVNESILGFLWNPYISYNAATFNNFNLNKSAVSINNFDITQDPSEGDLIISNANQNADRIIEAIRSNNQTIVNQNEEIILQQEAVNENLNEINDSLNDSNVDSSVGTNFFNNFSDTDHGGLSGIVTAPLNSINAMLSNTCTPISGTVYNKTFEIPCGTEMWSRLGVLKDFLNLTLGGLIVYNICRSLYLKIHNLKKPDDDRIEVMEL